MTKSTLVNFDSEYKNLPYSKVYILTIKTITKILIF